MVLIYVCQQDEENKNWLEDKAGGEWNLLDWMKRHEMLVILISSIAGTLAGLAAKEVITEVLRLAKGLL